MDLPHANLERAVLRLEGPGSMDLAALRGDEGLSTLFRYEAVCRIQPGGAAPSPDALLEKSAAFTLRDAFGGERVVTTIVADAELTPHEDGGATLALVLRPAAFVLTLGRDCRTFRDLDVVGIAKDVFARGGVKVRWDVAGTYAVREYTAQYRESDWDFVSRLFEEDGLYYWFDHHEESVLVVADKSSAAPDLVGGPAITYRAELGLSAAAEHIVEFGGRNKLAASKISLGSFDPSRPAFKVGGGSGDDGIEVYDAPGAGHVDPSVLDARAQVKLEIAQSEAVMARGRSPSVRLAPGRAFEMSDHAFNRFDGRYVVVATSFSADNLGWGRSGESKPIEVRFRALPAGVPYRAAQLTKAPRHAGLQSGVVVGPPGGEVHPDGAGRVRLQQHWDAAGTGDDTSGRWVRVAQRGTAGSMLLPRVGWNVLSLGEGGSVDSPHVLSRTFDGEHLPPYTLPDNKTVVTYKTATTPGGGSHNEIKYEDKKGSEEMFINSTKDLNVLVKDAKEETVHANMLHCVGVEHTLTVGTTYDVYVKGDQKVVVGGNQSETVAAARAKLVQGDESIAIAGSRSLKTGANLETTSSDSSRKVGAAQLDITLGGIDAVSPMVNVLVGGAMAKVTPRKMSESVGQTVSASSQLGRLPAGVQKVAGLPGISGAVGGLLAKIPSAQIGAAFQTIGVGKFELGTSRQIKVSKTYTERVLGMMTLKSLTKLTDIAKSTFKLEALALTGTAKKVTIKSDASVTLKCGDTTITVSAGDDKKKGGIAIDTKRIELNDATLLTAKAPHIDHN